MRYDDIMKNINPLDHFHPIIRRWFSETFGAPTDIQSRAWPEIAREKHVLVTAPTGSGKTVTAFLWAINQLATGAWSAGRTRVLYVSPLKALNNDIQKNLLTPLAELSFCLQAAGEVFPSIGVLTRSGDTPAEERRQMLRRPPEILITTPESLNIILSSRSGQALLTGIATVILDEIHAVVGTKRGTHLITAVDRLVPLCGEFQRIALSATVKPLATVAAFVGGFVLRGGKINTSYPPSKKERSSPSFDERVPETSPPPSGRKEAEYFYEKRPVEIIQSQEQKRSRIEVRFPPDARERLVDASWWPVLVEAFKAIIKANRSTLLFANSRRTAEKVTRLINEGEAEDLAYSHHGSLSREIRLAVEQRLKSGEIKAIVATSSLELGIDIGTLDQVVLIQTPPAIASAIQRIGRSGHSVGGESRGVLYPTHGHDFLTAAVLARCVIDEDIESVRPIDAPLDVLAQVICSMTGMEKWDIDELYAFLKTSYPYHDLTRRQFDLVLEMLAGRYADTRLRELKPRLSLDRIDNTVQGKEGVLRLLYLSGGTIPDRGYYDLRMAETHARIGELDEEFVWERSVGDTFTLGAQVWQIRNVTHNDVEVTPADTKPGIFPFWRAEDMNRDFHFSEKILKFLGHFHTRLDDPSLKEELRQAYFLDEAATDELIGYMQRQRAATKADLPHRRHLLIEHFQDPLNTSDAKQVILHTLWGGRINRPFSLALQAAWEEKYNVHIEVIENNDCILLMLPHDFSAGDIFALVTPENLERLLRQTLGKSGFFGAKFRENAGRALLLPRADFKRRLPLWLNRLRSKKLMDAVMVYADFPILLETWRTCLQDEFDLDNLKRLLEEIRSGEIIITEATTPEASPFADGLIWKQTNAYMYADDTPPAGKTSQFNRELLSEVLFSGRLRPRIPGAVIASLEERLRRTAPGYAPRSADDLLDWIKDRVLIPAPEWMELTAAMERDREILLEDAIAPIREKIIFIAPPGAAVRSICAVENLGRLAGALQITPREVALFDVLPHNPLRGKARSAIDAFAASSNQEKDASNANGLSAIFLQWLSFYGPLRKSSIRERLGLDETTLDGMLAALAEAQDIVIDLIAENAAEVEVCDRENLEILLRMARRARQPVFRALGIDHLPLFLAAYQGLAGPGASQDNLQNVLDQLFGFPAHADAWEKHILPARLAPYYSAWLDGLMQSSDLIWLGCGKGRISFAFSDDVELFIEQTQHVTGAETAEDRALPDVVADLIPRKIGRYSFFDIVRHANQDSRTVSRKLWDLTWQGRLTNDAFGTLRQGILTNFAPVSLKAQGTRPSRSAYNRWAKTRPLAGNWFVIDAEDLEKDSIDEAELVKDRVRQLLRRYGIVFREILANELPPLQWGKVFKALRLMELSGEILSGHFFEGIPGLQFMAHEALRFLNEPLPEDAIYWINAADPASLCGIKLEALKGKLPSRIPSTDLVYHGRKLVVISRRGGSSLKVLAPPEDPYLPAYLGFFKILLTRDFAPEKIILVEQINDIPALDSPYAETMKTCGFRTYHKGLELVKQYRR